MKNFQMFAIAKNTATLMLVFSLALLFTGCTTGAKLRTRSIQIDDMLKQMYKRAYKCSPKELAMAESHNEFGKLELDQGDFMRSREHLDIAFENIQKADLQSRGVECQDIEIVVADSDGDGYLDDVDQCPQDPEDFDNYEDEDGCPEDQDTDKDGIADSKDLCPTEPEDFDGDQDEDGCPDIEHDKDGDGIVDAQDACPLDPEDKDNYQDEDGCPEPDNDSDGILDVADNCPNEPEDKDGWQDEDGCPDFDNDGDRILDVADKCPNEPEDYDGDQDDDGCIDEYKLIVVTDNKIELKDKVHFETNKARIMPDSFEMLTEVSKVLVSNSAMIVRIEGHTDSRGSAKHNQILSDKRAKSVRDFLIERMVNSDRLIPIGYGEEEPIEDNSTEEGRFANRRVEFHIISQ